MKKRRQRGWHLDKSVRHRQFKRGYIACALWTCAGEDYEPLARKFSDQKNFGGETQAQMEKECVDFITQNAADLAEYVTDREAPGDSDNTPSDCAGHDFWLTRNGHDGFGFHHRGMGELGDRLADAARSHGKCWLYESIDGKIYLQQLQDTNGTKL